MGDVARRRVSMSARQVMPEPPRTRSFSLGPPRPRRPAPPSCPRERSEEPGDSAEGVGARSCVWPWLEAAVLATSGGKPGFIWAGAAGRCLCAHLEVPNPPSLVPLRAGGGSLGMPGPFAEVSDLTPPVLNWPCRRWEVFGEPFTRP